MEDEHGHVLINRMCHQCKLETQREIRRAGGYARTQKKYEKTIGGILVRRLQTVRRWGWGINSDEFYSWAKQDKEFRMLYIAWRDSGNKKEIAPCVVVIDLSKPPSIENCAWVPYSVKRGLNLMEIRSGRSAAPTRQLRRTP